MRLQVVIDDELAGYGHTEGDDLVIDEWVNGWSGVERVSYATVRETAGITVRSDDTIPVQGGTLTLGDGSTQSFGPGRMRWGRIT